MLFMSTTGSFVGYDLQPFPRCPFSWHVGRQIQRAVNNKARHQAVFLSGCCMVLHVTRRDCCWNWKWPHVSHFWWLESCISSFRSCGILAGSPCIVDPSVHFHFFVSCFSFAQFHQFQTLFLAVFSIPKEAGCFSSRCWFRCSHELEAGPMSLRGHNSSYRSMAEVGFCRFVAPKRQSRVCVVQRQL